MSETNRKISNGTNEKNEKDKIAFSLGLSNVPKPSKAFSNILADDDKPKKLVISMEDQSKSFAAASGKDSGTKDSTPVTESVPASNETATENDSGVISDSEFQQPGRGDGQEGDAHNGGIRGKHGIHNDKRREQLAADPEIFSTSRKLLRSRKEVKVSLIDQIEKARGSADRKHEEEALQSDLHNRPAAPTLESYAHMPVSEFSKAMMAGMGWSEGDPIGLTNRAVVPVYEQKMRPTQLGLGATEEDAKISKQLKQLGVTASKHKADFKRGDFIRVYRGKDVIYGIVNDVYDENRILYIVFDSRSLGIKEDWTTPDEAEYLGDDKVSKHSPFRDFKKKLLKGYLKTALTAAEVKEKEKAAKEKLERRGSSHSKTRGRSPQSHSRSRSHSRSNSTSRSRSRSESSDSTHDRKHKHSHHRHHHRRHHRSSSCKQKKEVKTVEHVADRGCWVRHGLTVRCISENKKYSRFYEKKGEVVDVVSLDECVVRFPDGTASGTLLTLSLGELETVIPQEGGTVLVVAGKDKGQIGKLARKVDGECADVNIDLSVVRYELDNICQYRPQELDVF